MVRHNGPVVLVLDNAPCHSRIEQDVLNSEFVDCKILRLSPHSPFLNPIENIWYVVKHYVNRNLSKEMDKYSQFIK